MRRQSLTAAALAEELETLGTSVGSDDSDEEEFDQAETTSYADSQNALKLLMVRC